MKIKPSKSRSISIIKGRQTSLFLHWGRTHTNGDRETSQKPIGRWYDVTLKDTEQVDQLRQETLSGLERIDKSLRPGRLKL